MALKALLDSIDGLSDEIKAQYKQVAEGDSAGKYVLDVETAGGLVLENVEGLKSALGATKAELDTAKSAIDGYKGLPNAKAVRDQLAELARLKQLDPEKEADKLATLRMESQIAEFNKKHETALAAHEDRAKQLTSQVERLLIDSESMAAITAEKGDPELLLPFIRPRLRMVEQDGTFSVQVLDAHGNQEYAVRDNKPVEATIKDLVARFKANEKFGQFFAASGTSGGGSQQSTRGPGGTQVNPFTKGKSWNMTEQMKLMKSNPTLAAAMKAQAEAAG